MRNPAHQNTPLNSGVVGGSGGVGNDALWRNAGSSGGNSLATLPFNPFMSYPPHHHHFLQSHPHHHPHHHLLSSIGSVGGERNWGEIMPSSDGVQVSSNGQLPATVATPSSQTGRKSNKKPRRRIASVAQRRAANIRERRRMFSLNEGFDKLRRKVPTFAYEKRLSRIETLRLAVTYIAFMGDLLSSSPQQSHAHHPHSISGVGSRNKSVVLGKCHQGEGDGGEDEEHYNNGNSNFLMGGAGEDPLNMGHHHGFNGGGGGEFPPAGQLTTPRIISSSSSYHHVPPPPPVHSSYHHHPAAVAAAALFYSTAPPPSSKPE